MSNIGFRELNSSQLYKTEIINENFLINDVLLHGFQGFRSSPPSTAVTNDAYIVEATASGLWTGQENKIAIYQNGYWNFVDAVQDLKIFNRIDKKEYIYDTTDGWGVLTGVTTAYTSTGISGPEPSYTDNEDGTVTVSGTNVRLYDNPDFEGAITEYEIPETTLSISNGENFICATLDGSGGAEYQNCPVSHINESDFTPVLTMHVENSAVSVCLGWDRMALGLSNKLHLKDIKVGRFDHEKGCIISDFGTRNVAFTEGSFWLGGYNINTAAFDSTVDEMYLYYYDGSTWQKSSDLTQYNNTQYNDMATGLVDLGNNDFGVNHFFRIVSATCNTVIIILDNQSYNTPAEALNATAPAELPEIIDYHAEYAGKIVIEKNSDDPIYVRTAFGTTTNFRSVSDHNNLSNINGGTWHLSETDYNALTDTNAQLTALHTDGSPTFAGLNLTGTASLDAINSYSDNGIDFSSEALTGIASINGTDPSNWLTSESDTLYSVTNRGNSTNNKIRISNNNGVFTYGSGLEMLFNIDESWIFSYDRDVGDFLTTRLRGNFRHTDGNFNIEDGSLNLFSNSINNVASINGINPNNWLTSESDTLYSVTNRGNSTNNKIRISGSNGVIDYGSGIELLYNSGEGDIFTYDRDVGEFLITRLRGNFRHTEGYFAIEDGSLNVDTVDSYTGNGIDFSGEDLSNIGDIEADVIYENSSRVYSPNNEVSGLYREDTLDEKICEARYDGLYFTSGKNRIEAYSGGSSGDDLIFNTYDPSYGSDTALLLKAFSHDVIVPNGTLQTNTFSSYNQDEISINDKISVTVNTKTSHPTNYKPLYQDTDTGEYYTLS